MLGHTFMGRAGAPVDCHQDVVHTFEVCLTKVKPGRLAHDRGVGSGDQSIKQHREQDDGHQDQRKRRHDVKIKSAI